MPTRVLVDANVLYSKTLRDWLCLLYLASDTYFAVYWTEDALAETIAHLRDKHPQWRGGKITKIHDQIKATCEDERSGVPGAEVADS